MAKGQIINNYGKSSGGGTPTLSKIEIVNPPNKTSFYNSDTLDTYGLVVEAVYSDNSREDITNKVILNPVQNAKLKTTNDKITISYTAGSNTISVIQPIVVNLKIVSWADGTDEEIVEMVEVADRGEITLSDYWSVGDERKIALPTMQNITYHSNHVAQTITFVLMNQGGKTLVNPTPSGRTECSFIVGAKEVLHCDDKMNLGETNSNGWVDSHVRLWCNNVFRNAMPESIRPIFKLFQNPGSGMWGTQYITTEDWFAFPSVMEVLGKKVYGDYQQSRFTYYETAGGVKSLSDQFQSIDSNGNVLPNTREYWTRSLYSKSDGSSFSTIPAVGTMYLARAANYRAYYSPFGVI